MPKLSVYMIACNEEQRIERTLAAAAQVADEIVLVDSGSTDRTLEIAQKYQARVLPHKWVSYANQKNFAQNQCKNKWLLSLDADEVLSPDLIREIKAWKQTKPACHVYRIKIADILPGMAYKRWTRTYNLIRLYHREYATMRADLLTADRIHPTAPVKVGQFRAPVWHYSVLTVSQHVQKLNHYTDEVQAHIQKKKKSYSTLRLVGEFPLQFLNYYFIRRYIIHGRWGFVAAMNLAYARFLRIAKAMENERR